MIVFFGTLSTITFLPHIYMVSKLPLPSVSSGPEESTFLVQCSYIEVYKERLNDLLGDRTNLILRELPDVGLLIEGEEKGRVLLIETMRDGLAD